MRCHWLSAAAAALCALVTSAGHAATLFSENFDVDPTSNWTVNGGPSDESADFYYDYSAVGIPEAPNSSGSAAATRGLKLQANLTGGVFSGLSVSPTGQAFTGDYRLKFDWWGNYNGPYPHAGNGSTNLSTFGVKTNGTTAQWAGATHSSVWFAAAVDGGAAQDYRAYSPTGLYLPASGVYAAGTTLASAGPPAVFDARNDLHPYYEGLGGVFAPAAQQALYDPAQSEATRPGSAGLRWHEVEIAKIGDIVTWTLSGKLIATVDASALSLSGDNIFFGHSDINAGVSADPNAAALLFTLIDNVVVSRVPEPASVALVGLAGLGLAAVRRRR
jgi:hypothetical protein